MFFRSAVDRERATWWMPSLGYRASRHQRTFHDPSSWKTHILEHRFQFAIGITAPLVPPRNPAELKQALPFVVANGDKKERGGGRRRINVTSNPANKEVPFFNDNIFPPYSIVMSHVAVENVHGLEQQVRRTAALFLQNKQ